MKYPEFLEIRQMSWVSWFPTENLIHRKSQKFDPLNTKILPYSNNELPHESNLQYIRVL